MPVESGTIGLWLNLGGVYQTIFNAIATAVEQLERQGRQDLPEAYHVTDLLKIITPLADLRSLAVRNSLHF